MWPNPQEIADIIKFTEEVLNGKLDFLCSGKTIISREIMSTQSGSKQFKYRGIFNLSGKNRWYQDASGNLKYF